MMFDRRGTSRKSRFPLNETFVSFLGLAIVAILLFGGILWLDAAIRSWHERDLIRRAMLVVRALDRDLELLPAPQLTEQLETLSQDERLVGILVCAPNARSIGNRALLSTMSCRSPLALRAIVAGGSPVVDFVGENEVVATAHAITPGSPTRLIVVQDFGFIWSRRQDFIRIAILITVVALGLFLIFSYQGAKIVRVRTMSRLVELFRGSQRGGAPREELPEDLSRIVNEFQTAAARMAREPGPISGPEQLRRLVAERMPDTPLVLVANREPYIHLRDGDGIRLERPASGLVTGVEPLLKATGGVWIAHGSGTADRDVTPPNGRIDVPPEKPEYLLHRVWLTQQEEEGYYYGFSNEGLWPLCHIAHTRPTFRTEDWVQYQAVNRKFAEAAAADAGEHGLVLIQDYHFALLPAELRRLAPDAVSSLFWHIPWPNAEVVGILPWKQEVLAGMLGADVIGFHTRYHCLNFLETVGRYLEARVQLESMSVEYQGHRTRVRPYPISVRWPYPSPPREEGEALRRSLGIPRDVHLVIGVDRADYTKGLIERVMAIETLLEMHPELVGRFVFLQIAAPSRTHIKRYRDFVSELEETATRINRRFGRNGYVPILLQIRHFTPEEVRRVYSIGDVALITPLHDGMNLVAKEYVASRADERGALVLSVFTGAARELEGALLVNPYDAKEVALALYQAIHMPEAEQKARMEAMRRAIEKNTIYDWSAALLSDLSEVWERRNAAWRQQGAAGV